jgi:hypothetical protein
LVIACQQSAETGRAVKMEDLARKK